MKSHIKNNSALKSTLKIPHVVKQLKEDNKCFWRCCVEGENKRKKKEKKKFLGLETYLSNEKYMVNLTIYCQIYSLDTESFISDILE